MPSCFQLTRKGMSSPAFLTDVDRAICQYLEVPVDDERFVHYWYSTIGLGLAIGRSWEEIADCFSDCPELLQINHYLQENYTADAWHER